MKYSESSRLTRPHSHYAESETIAILTDANKIHLKQDSCYALSDSMSCLIERLDATDKLILAFDGLIDIINRDPPSPGHHDTLGLMGSGTAVSDASESDGEVSETLWKVSI